MLRTEAVHPLGQAQKGSRLGARGRIGLIQPAAAIVLEHEWPLLLPPDTLFPNARVPLNGPRPTDYETMETFALGAADMLISAGADIICYACTVGSIYAGADHERRFLAGLADRCGKKALGIGAASVAAIQALSAQSVAILSPYAEDINALVVRYLQDCGIQVAGVNSLGVGFAEAVLLPPAEVAQIAADALAAHPTADALWMPCTAIRTIEAIPQIEALAGRPVVSGSQGLLWAALRRLGICDPMPSGGKLLTL